MFKNMHVTFADGTERDVHGKRADLITFERKFGIAASTLFDGGIWTERLWFLAWCADHRETPDGPDFEDWIQSVEMVEIVNNEEEGAEEVPPTDPDSTPTP